MSGRDTAHCRTPRSSRSMARPSLSLPTLLMSLRLITEHVSFGLLSAAEGPHCCTCTREFQTSCFLRCVEQGAPRQPWQGLEEPQHHFPANTMAGRSRGDHTGQPVRGLPGESLCFALPRWSPPCRLTGTLRRRVTGGGLPSGWRCRWRSVCYPSTLLPPAAPEPLSPPSGPTHRNLASAGLTCLVRGEGVPHDHLPILNENTQMREALQTQEVTCITHHLPSWQHSGGLFMAIAQFIHLPFPVFSRFSLYFSLHLAINYPLIQSAK